MEITKRYANEDWTREYTWIKHGDTLYIANSTYDEKDIVKQAGLRWHPILRVWWTNDINRAAKLSEYADTACSDELESVRKQRFESTQASRAVDTSVELSHPDGIDYFGFQRAGIVFCLRVFGVLK
jgi:hypothetical protein